MMTASEKRIKNPGMNFIKVIREKYLELSSPSFLARWLEMPDATLRQAETKGTAMNMVYLSRLFWVAEKEGKAKPRQLLDLIYDEWLPLEDRKRLADNVKRYPAKPDSSKRGPKPKGMK